MRKILKLSLVSLCASGAVFSMQARNHQSASNNESDKQLVITEPAGADASASATVGAPIMRSSNLIGERAFDSSGKHIGTVKDTLIDLNSGRLAFVVIDRHGKQIAVPGSACRVEGDRVMLNVDKERLASAPAFDYNNINDPNWAQQTYSFYGQSWQGGQVGMTSPSWQSSGTAYQSGTSYQQNQGNVAYQQSEPMYQSGSSYQRSTVYPSRGMYEASGAQIGGPALVTGRDQDAYANCILHHYQAGKGAARVTDEHFWNNVPADRLYSQYPGSGASYQNYAYSSYSQPMSTTTYSSQWSQPSSSQQGEIWYGPGGRTYSSAGSSMSAPMSSSSGVISESAGASAGMHLYRSSDLIGMHIRASNGQDLGEIRDVVLDMNSGRVAYAVVVPTSGEFGGKYLAIPPTAFTRSGTDQHVLTVNMSADQLRSAPSFEPNNWPQPQNTTFIGQVYNFYHVSPYWQGNEGEMHHGRMHHEGYQGSSTQGYQGSSTSGTSQGSSTEQQNLNQGAQGSIQNQGTSTEQNLNNQNQQQNQQPANEPSGTSSEQRGSSSGLQGSQGAVSSPSSSSDQTSSSSSSSSGLQSDQSKGQSSQSSSSLNEPAGAQSSSATQSGTSGAQSSTELKSQSQPGSATSEAAGAQTGTSSSTESTQPSSSSTESSSTQPSSSTESSTQPSTSSTSTSPDQSSASTQSSTSTSDQGMTEKVRSTLKTDTTLSPLSSNVTVQDQNGKVALNGTVKSEAEKQQIVSKAEEIAGSGNVIDNLQVKAENESGSSNSSNPSNP